MEAKKMNLFGNLNSRFKIGTRIGAGFFMLLALLLMVAASGYLGLQGAADAFRGLTRTSDNMAHVEQADRDFVAIRLNMQFYFQNSDEKALARIHELSKTVRAGFATSRDAGD